MLQFKYSFFKLGSDAYKATITLNIRMVSRHRIHTAIERIKIY